MAINDISLTSGMRSNLLNLQSTSNLLDRTQTRLSTGKKVNSALDDPIAYFTAKSHTNRASDLSAKKDSMSEAVQVIKAADKGIEGMTGLLSQAKSLATAAATSSDKKALAEQFNEVLKQIGEMAKDSGYGGVNLVQGTEANTDLAVDHDGNQLYTDINGNATTDLTSTFAVEQVVAVTDPGGGAPITWGADGPSTWTDSQGTVRAYESGDHIDATTGAAGYLDGDGNLVKYTADQWVSTSDRSVVVDDGDASLNGDGTRTIDNSIRYENKAELTVDFNETGSSKIDLQGFDVSVNDETGNLTLTKSDGTIARADSALGNAPTISAIDTTAAEINFGDAIAQIDAATDALRSESSTLSSNLSIITTRQDFTTDMINTLTEGADTLTAADMNEEGANMLMLQTRQQLSTRALALSAQSAQAVLSLF